MSCTKEQKQSAYKKLPLEVQDLIMSGETTELVEQSLQEVGLNDEQSNLADSEILYALICLQSLDDAINNIAKLSGKNVADLSKLKSAIQDNIFNKYTIDINVFVEKNAKLQISTPLVMTDKPEQKYAQIMGNSIWNKIGVYNKSTAEQIRKGVAPPTSDSTPLEFHSEVQY